MRTFTRVIDTFFDVIPIVLILCIVLFIGDALIQSVPHIDIEEYEENIDYGILSNKQIETFNNIIYAAQNEESVVNCPIYTNKERHEIVTQLGMYFGSVEEIGDLVYWSGDNANLNLGMFKKLLDQKIIIDERVNEAVSTLMEGSDEYKLWQISNYISAKIVYTEGFRSTITALNGKGVCNSYAMLFYKMATRLGIKSYICYGYAGDGYHVWNMVELNGKHIHYDITWYDNTVHDIRYIHNKSSWNRNFQINNKWSTDLS